MRKLLQGQFKQQVGARFATQIVYLALSIANAAIIARWLGPEGQGMLALTLLVPGMLGLFLSGGIGAANTYFAGSRRLDVPALTANSVAFSLLATISAIGVIGGLLTTGSLQVIMPGVPLWVLLVAMLGLPMSVLGGYFSGILLGLQRIMTLSMLGLVQGLLTLSLTVLFVIGFQMGLLGALLASIITGAVSLLIMGFLLGRERGVFVPRWDRSVIRSTLAFGLKGHVGIVLQFFNYRLDMFIVNYFLGPAGAGLYSVSVRLAELLWYLPNAVGFAIFPKVAATGADKMNAFTPRVFRMTLGLTVLGALGLALLGKPIIQLVYSSVFEGAYVPMLVLLPGVVLLGGAKVLTNEMAGRGYPLYNSVNTSLTLMVTVLLDWVLIPRFGIIGAALASTIAYITMFVMTIGFHWKVKKAT
jgi:O-antigen/teichoic acid export membrane protein